MLRAVFLGVAVLVLTAACALVPAPQPAGTRPIEVSVHNDTPAPLAVSVRTPPGVAPGAAEPPVAPPGLQRTPVTVYVPLLGEWTLVLGDGAANSVQITRVEYAEYEKMGCQFGVSLGRDGSYEFGCFDDR